MKREEDKVEHLMINPEEVSFLPHLMDMFNQARAYSAVEVVAIEHINRERAFLTNTVAVASNSIWFIGGWGLLCWFVVIQVHSYQLEFHHRSPFSLVTETIVVFIKV